MSFFIGKSSLSSAAMRVFHDIKVGLDEELEEKLAWMNPGYGSYRILRKSVDARQRHNPHLVYTCEVYDQGEAPPKRDFKLEPVSDAKRTQLSKSRPIIVGAGPAGLFAALRFVERGIPCLIIERGSESKERMRKINRFWRYGELDPNNNVCYGEGGAGLYSDGKLITRIKSPFIPYVMNKLVQFGAPPEIEYESNPHVGSDRIRRVIPYMREYLLANGCEILFDTQVHQLIYKNNSVVGVKVRLARANDGASEIYSDHVIIATGHSAEDFLEHLRDNGVYVEGKSFAMGLRIEHPQKLINQIQYREAADHPKLGSANYKLAHHNKQNDIGVYSFCMCPGGYVLSSGTDLDGIVCNGMSNYARNSPFANAAIVVTVEHKTNFGDDKWGGMKLRKHLESKALQMVRAGGGTKEIPAQRLIDFMTKRTGPALPSSSPSHVMATRLDQLFPESMYKALVDGIEKFGQNMKGFVSDQAQLHGIESRTSCPVRITRHAETLESLSHSGLYPCGEGAGYAGGITSAACDGIRIAERIMGRSQDECEL